MRPGQASLLAAALVLLAATGRSQDLQQRVEAETFFADEPAWIFAVRPALGYDPEDSFFPQLGLGLGYQFENHLFLGGNLAGRFTEPYHVRLAFRLGVFFSGADLAFGFGTSPGFMVRSEAGEFGPVLTWGGEGRLRLSRSNFLTLFGEFDLLYRILGFRRTTWLFSGGIGWAHAF